MTDHTTKNLNLKMPTIIAAVCVAFDEPAINIMGPRKYRSTARARMAAATIIRELRGMSSPRIARALNRMDHSTIIHAVHATHSRIERDPDFAERYNEARTLALECAASGLRWPPSLNLNDRAVLSGQVIKPQPVVKFEPPPVDVSTIPEVKMMAGAHVDDHQMRVMIDRGTRRMAMALSGAAE